MDKIIVGGNVTGNVGSCQVNSQNITVSSFKIQTMAVNSCTGELVSNNTYVNWAGIGFGLIVGVLMIAIISMILGLSKMLFSEF